MSKIISKKEAIKIATGWAQDLDALQSFASKNGDIWLELEDYLEVIDECNERVKNRKQENDLLALKNYFESLFLEFEEAY